MKFGFTRQRIHSCILRNIHRIKTEKLEEFYGLNGIIQEDACLKQRPLDKDCM